MTGTDSEDIQLWIAAMMRAKGIRDYKLDLAGQSSKGDGYLGEITFAKVYCDGISDKCYDVVVKAAKKSKELRRKTPIKEAYDREIFFYDKVLPVFMEFQKARAIEGVRIFNNTPTCYHVCRSEGREAILLQDLRVLGYALHDRQKAMNLDHVALVLKNYGRFHALSLALKHKQPAVFRSLTKNMGNIMGEFVDRVNMLQVFRENHEHVVQLLQEQGCEDVVKKFQRFPEEMQSVVQMEGFDVDKQPAVLLHGDCWNNNFIFKYENGNKEKPVDMCFLDFQLSSLASPCRDLSYFMYCCGDKKIFDNFDKLLRIYHTSLCDFLTELGCDPSELFPLKTLKEQWKTHGKYGILLTLMVLKISLCDANEAPDFIDAAESGEDLGKSINIQIKDTEQYDRRMMDVYKHFSKEFL